MAREKKSQYVCQQCGYESTGWLGKCPNCGAWGSLVETITGREGRKENRPKNLNKPISLPAISSKKIQRTVTKIPELDRVLGGGLVPGEVTLIAGEPGIGKSTLLLHLADNLAGAEKQKILYVSGEESVNQIKIRAERLKINKKGIDILEENDVDNIVDQIQSNYSEELACIIVDSIQTLSTSSLSGLAGSVGQVRESAFRLLRTAKSLNVPLFLVGHVTKEGTVAGPAVLAHIVDTVLWFEGDKSHNLRFLRAVKNRFGPTDEVGIFTMEEKGLISEENPESLFLRKDERSIPGSILSVTLQGTRPFVVEIQSLVVPTKLAFPKRIAQGMDLKRLDLLLAILTRRAGLNLFDFDCFVNITGGIVVREPAVDLAVCLSIASSYFEKPLPSTSIAIGEAGLLGEIREVPVQERRIKEAKRLGFGPIVTNKSFDYVSQAIRKYLKE